MPHRHDSVDPMEKEAGRIIARGQSLLSQDQPNPAALLAVAVDLNSLIGRLTAEKQRIQTALLGHDQRIRAVSAYARH